MLTKKDKDKIIEKKKQGYSYEKIREEYGYAIDTIMNVCKEYGESTKKETEEKKGESKKAKKDQANIEILSFDSIDNIRKIPDLIDYCINKGQLKTKEVKVWEKRINQMRELIRNEIDEPISIGIEAAIKKMMMNGKRILKKDEIISEYQNDISELKAIHQIEKRVLKKINNEFYNNNCDLVEENKDLIKVNKDLKYRIDYRLDKEIREPQENLKNKEIKFEKFLKENQLEDEGRSLNLEKREIEVEIREKKLAEQELEFKKHVEDIIKLRRQLRNITEEKLKLLEKILIDVTELEKK